MIRLESEPIILLDVHCCSSYVHWKPGYLSNDYIRCSSSSLIRTLQIVYHAFQFIGDNIDFVPCLACSSYSAPFGWQNFG